MTSKLAVNKDVAIYDIYVLTEGGIPIFAGCSTSDYCASHAGQHPLHAGFIHALQNFGDEVFSSNLRDLKFDSVKLNFETAGPYTVVFVNPVWVKDEYIHEKLLQVSNLLIDDYVDRIQEHSVSEELYHDFMDDIVDLGLIAKDRVKLTREIFISESGSREPENTRNQSIFARFKQKFESLIGY